MQKQRSEDRAEIQIKNCGLEKGDSGEDQK